VENISNFVQTLTPEHLILIGMGFLAWRWLKKQNDEALKTAAKDREEHRTLAKEEIRSSLGNGIGDLVKKLNEAQDERWILLLDKKFGEHERREDVQIRTAVDDAKRVESQSCERVLHSIDEHDQRLRRLEDDIRSKRRSR
jgi:hypothetical protein